MGSFFIREKATKESKNGKGISKYFYSGYREMCHFIFSGCGFFYVAFAIQLAFASFLAHKIFYLIMFCTRFHN